ncbi:Protein flp, partial [Lachnellula subtilissima]
MFPKLFALMALLQLMPCASVKDTLELWHVPGVSIAVVDGNDTWAEVSFRLLTFLYNKPSRRISSVTSGMNHQKHSTHYSSQGYGVSIFPSTPVTPETLFCGASTTKAFTAAAMALLISSSDYTGLSWDTPISSLIREDFVLPDLYSTEHVTIEDALSHRTGMPAHDASCGGTDEKGEKRGVRDLVRSLRHLPLTAPLRTRFQYCNMMFVAVSHVVETLTGVWLGDFLKENIWEPLGMKSTYFDTDAAQAAPEPFAQGYVYYEEKYQPVPYMDLDIVSGAGAVTSNVLDYSKWIRAFLTTSGPLSKSDYAALKTLRTLLPTSGELSRFLKPYTGPGSYALGWFNGVYQGYEHFGHSGSMEAFGAEVVILPDLNYGVVSFGNTGKTSNFAILKLIYHLIDEKLAIPPEKRYDWNK